MMKLEAIMNLDKNRNPYENCWHSSIVLCFITSIKINDMYRGVPAIQMLKAFSLKLITSPALNKKPPIIAITSFKLNRD